MENDSITKFNQSLQPTTQLPARLNVTEVYPLQLKLWQGLKTSSVSLMVAETQIPTLAKIKNDASETDARALLYIAVCEVCDFFNVGKNMNDTQVAITVDLILESFWHLKPTEIKYCFRRAMMREKLFDRLDGNIIIGWLREYDAERTEEAMRISEQEESQKSGPLATDSSTAGAISFQQYLETLRERAKTDPNAAELLEVMCSTHRSASAPVSREKREQDRRKFQLFRLNYLSQKRKK